MTQIDDLVGRIESKVGCKDRRAPFLVAIDGHSAAGKSTFSRALSAAWPGAALVHTDDFYRVMDADVRFALDAAGGYEFYYDWQRLGEEVLRPLKAGNDVQFQIYDWGANRLGDRRKINAAALVIVEGCYAARPEYMPMIDFVVLVETDPELRMRRQKARADASVDWLARWDAAERYYFEKTNLAERADMVVNGQ